MSVEVPHTCTMWMLHYILYIYMINTLTLEKDKAKTVTGADQSRWGTRAEETLTGRGDEERTPCTSAGQHTCTLHVHD